MARDGEVLVAVAELAAGVLPEDGALRAHVAAVGEPGDVGVSDMVDCWLAVLCLLRSWGSESGLGGWGESL